MDGTQTIVIDKGNSKKTHHSWHRRQCHAHAEFKTLVYAVTSCEVSLCSMS